MVGVEEIVFNLTVSKILGTSAFGRDIVNQTILDSELRYTEFNHCRVHKVVAQTDQKVASLTFLQ